MVIWGHGAFVINVLRVTKVSVSFIFQSICVRDYYSGQYISVFDHLLLELIYHSWFSFGADVLVSITCCFSACQRECLAIKILFLLLLGALICNAELFPRLRLLL